jgi:hypothetical protein
MELKTRLDWQGYRLALQNEQTMGCSEAQTAMCVSISEYREKVHQMQELLRETAAWMRKLYPHANQGMLPNIEAVLAPWAPVGAYGSFAEIDLAGQAPDGLSEMQPCPKCGEPVHPDNIGFHGRNLCSPTREETGQ